LQKWDITSSKQIGTLDVGASPWTMSLSPNGKTLAVGYRRTGKAPPERHSVRLWDVTTGQERGRLPLGQAVAKFVSWSADGTRLAAGTDSRLWAWDVKTGQPLGASAPGHDASIAAFAFTPDGRLFTAGDDHTVRSWDAVTGRPGLVLVQDHWVRDVAVSPDGSLVAGSALENDLRVWDAKTGEQRFKLRGNGRLGGKRLVGFTVDGARLVAWGDDECLRVWDTRNGKLLVEAWPTGEADDDDPFAHERRMMDTALAGSAISPDGSLFALNSNAAVRVFDTASGQEKLKFEVGAGGAMKMAFSHDGKRLAAAGRGKPIQTKLPDGRMRVSTEPQHLIVVWDLSEKKSVWTATAEGSSPGAVGFSPDGSRVAASGLNQGKPNTIHFWDAATGKDAGRIEVPMSARHFAFDRAGKRLAVAFEDTTALVYDLGIAIKPAPPE
jgi:WD40 repeat protein